MNKFSKNKAEYKVELNDFEKNKLNLVSRLSTKKHLMGVYTRMILILRDENLKNSDSSKTLEISIRDLASRYKWFQKMSKSTIANRIDMLCELGLIEKIKVCGSTSSYYIPRIDESRVEPEVSSLTDEMVEGCPDTMFSYLTEEDLITAEEYYSRNNINMPSDKEILDSYLDSFNDPLDRLNAEIEVSENPRILKEYTINKTDLSNKGYIEHIKNKDKVPSLDYVLNKLLEIKKEKFPKVKEKTLDAIRYKLKKLWSNITIAYCDNYLISALENQIEKNQINYKAKVLKENLLKAQSKSKLKFCSYENQREYDEDEELLGWDSY